MLNVNFVPDDYIQSSESRRANLMYLVLFGVVMAVLGGSFLTIRVRQRSLNSKEKFVDAKIARVQESIKQFEELQVKQREMMKTALTTAELLEPVPRSVLLASLTNNLPPAVSLLKLKLVQKEPKNTGHVTTNSRYRSARSEGEAALTKVSPEKLLETQIDIEGMAPSDLQVAAYIERLSSSSLLDSVALIESKERKIKDATFRQFKLTAVLRKDVHLTKGDVDRIRDKAEESVYNF